jgi:uncharacterized membrane protein
MNIDLSLTHQIDEIQRKLRECNFECNRLKDLVLQSLPALLLSREQAETELQTKNAQVHQLQQELAALKKRQKVSHQDAPVPAPESLVAEQVPTVSPDLNAPVVEPVTVTPAAEPVAPVLEVTTTPVTSPPVTASPPGSPRSKKAPAKSREGLEDFIGGNLLNKIGIGILIIGIGIFVKYAIDQDWIGPVGRVMVGLLSGGILLGVAHWLRKSYKAFSSVLLGGGIAVLYFSVAIAFHQYELLSQPAAFALMCGITGASVFFSIAYNRQEIAVLALLGSFATPFMVSKGDGNYVVLFTYILVVNVGMLVLAWFREWRLVRMLGYGLTVLLFGGWLLREYSIHAGIVPTGSLVFGTLFFLVFFMTNLAYRIRKQQLADTFTYLSLISNSVFYYACSMLVMQQIGGGVYMGIFTAGMAVFHFSFILPLRKLLIGLVLTFVTLAIPIQLEGNYITLFWGLESLLLLYLAQRTRIGLLHLGSAIVSALTVVMLGWHWVVQYGGNADRTFLFNGAFLTSFLTAGAMIGLYALHRRDVGVNPWSPSLAKLYQFLSLPLLYIGVILELVAYDPLNEFGMAIRVSAFTAFYLAAMLVWALRSNQKVFGNVVTILGLLYFLLWSVAQITVLEYMRREYMVGETLAQGFPWHFVAFLGTAILLGLAFYHARKQVNIAGDMGKLLIWLTSILALVLFSMELDHVLGLMDFTPRITRKVGYPILWGLMGFGMIAWGMREKLIALRIGGLALFLLILLKLFIFDIREVSAGGKIAAFISLGVLLLVISFMYQRLRKLLIRDAEATESNS